MAVFFKEPPDTTKDHRWGARFVWSNPESERHLGAKNWSETVSLFSYAEALGPLFPQVPP